MSIGVSSSRRGCWFRGCGTPHGGVPAKECPSTLVVPQETGLPGQAGAGERRPCEELLAAGALF